MSPPYVFIIIASAVAVANLAIGREIEKFETGANQYDIDFVNLGECIRAPIY